MLTAKRICRWSYGLSGLMNEGMFLPEVKHRLVKNGSVIKNDQNRTSNSIGDMVNLVPFQFCTTHKSQKSNATLNQKKKRSNATQKPIKLKI